MTDSDDVADNSYPRRAEYDERRPVLSRIPVRAEADEDDV